MIHCYDPYNGRFTCCGLADFNVGPTESVGAQSLFLAYDQAGQCGKCARGLDLIEAYNYGEDALRRVVEGSDETRGQEARTLGTVAGPADLRATAAVESATDRGGERPGGSGAVRQVPPASGMGAEIETDPPGVETAGGDAV
jgi:hypothetical protein